MGVLKFRLNPPEPANRASELRKAYITGLDRTPERLSVEVRPGLMVCHRETPESGRLHVPWPVEGFGTPFVATATLVERAEPYDLAVELARGKLNEIRNQAADWAQMGLRLPAELEAVLDRARRAFARAAMARDEPARAEALARECLAATFQAGRLLVIAYTDQVLRRRLDHSERLSTLLGCGLAGDPRQAPWAAPLAEAINAARVRCPWGALEPAEGQFRWEEMDAQLAWCRKNRLLPLAGPLLEFRAGALPDWLWLWEGDFESIEGMAVDLVRQVVTRYRGKVGFWHLVGRPASTEVLGLSEDEQIRLTAKLVQVARQADPNAQVVIDFDRPWAEWMGAGPFQLGPLHLADSLARADLGLSGIGLEIAPGYKPPGSHLRDLFDFSRLLDLFALLNLPLHISLVFPSSDGPDPRADPQIAVEAAHWPAPPSEASQRDWAARWIALAVAKPFVRSVTWLCASDADPHVYPHGGLFRADQTPKPILDWLKSFRTAHLA